MSHAGVVRDPSPVVLSHFGLVCSFSTLQDMCKIALMYCRLIKTRAEALSLSKQNEGEAANRVGIGAGPTAREGVAAPTSWGWVFMGNCWPP